MLGTSDTEKSLLDIDGNLTLEGKDNVVEIALTDDKSLDLVNVAIINTSGGIIGEFDLDKVNIKK